IGRPIANTRVYVLDGNGGPVPVGVGGELYIGGEGLARGYVNRAELTAQRFVPDGLSGAEGQRLYRSGDLCRYLADGNLEFIGRKDQQVKGRGYRIELGEIEARLGGHPGVRESVVVARETDGGEKQLVGYVVMEEGGRAEELRAYLKERLPEYMVPAFVVRLERLPLTANGKVDRRSSPAPEGAGGAVEGHVAPRTAVEEILAGLYEEVLRVGRVGMRDNFFELGGHSLLATRLVSRVRESLGVELALRSLFEGPSVGELAGKVEELRAAGQGLKAPPLVRVERGGELPLSYAQERLWFLDQLEPGNRAYNIAGAVRIEGPLDVAALERVVAEIVRRHEVLRTRFELRGGRPVQVIGEESPIRLEVVALGGLESGERERRIRELAAAEARRPFDLGSGPLLRVKLVEVGAGEQVMLYVMHHIVSDGWSMEVLRGEFVQLYEAYRQEQPSPLAELPVQYADYAVWQRDWLRGEVLEEQLQYGREQLRGAPAQLELATERGRPAVQSYAGAGQAVVLGRELSQGLSALSRREGMTLFMVLSAGFKALLYRYSGQEDIVVGTPVANRNRKEIEGLIGFFVNTLVLRSAVSGQATFLEVARREREVALGAYE